MDINSIFDKIGDSVSNLTIKVIRYLGNLGLSVSETTSKIISIVIIALAIYLIAKIVHKPAKWIVIIGLGVIIVSLVLSLTA